MLITVEPQNGAKNKNAEAHFRNPCSYKMKSVYKQSRKTMVEPIIFVRSPAKFFLGLNKSIVTLIIGKKVEVSLRAHRSSSFYPILYFLRTTRFAQNPFCFRLDSA